MQSTYSHARVPVAWIMDPRIERDDLAVLTVLLGFTDGKSGNVKVRQSRVGELLAKSRTWVNSVFKRLEANKFIQIIASPTGRSQTYRVCIPGREKAVTSTDTSCKNTDTRCQSADTLLTDSESKLTLSRFAWDDFSDEWIPSSETLSEARASYPNTDLERHLKHFVSKVKARRYCYYDFDEAWLEWLKTDAKHFRIPDASSNPRKGRGEKRANTDTSKPAGKSVFADLLNNLVGGTIVPEGSGTDLKGSKPAGNPGPLLEVLATLPG